MLVFGVKGWTPISIGMQYGLWIVSELALQLVTRVVGEGRVPREYGCGVGKLYTHVHRTRIPRVVCRLGPEEGSRAMARPEDGHAAHEASNGDDDGGCTEVVKTVSVQPGILSVM